MLLDQFKASNAWDNRYNLPLCDGYNNPWIYMAYADLLMRIQDPTGPAIAPVEAENHFLKCEAAVPNGNPNRGPGLFMRWPDSTGGQTSHDEIMGACHLSSWIAKRIVLYLDAYDGEFNATGEKATVIEQFNVYRMLFLKPYIRACANLKVSILSQLVWIFCLLVDAITRDPQDCGGALRFWLMCYTMNQYPLCRIAIAVWKWRTQRIQTLKGCLTVEPGDFKIYGQVAPETW